MLRLRACYALDWGWMNWSNTRRVMLSPASVLSVRRPRFPQEDSRRQDDTLNEHDALRHTHCVVRCRSGSGTARLVEFRSVGYEVVGDLAYISVGLFVVGFIVGVVGFFRR